MLYYIDIVDACNLRCRTCVRGQRKVKNSQEKMSFSRFKKIVVKAKEKGATTVGLYNWTEPFLHPEINKFVKEVVDNNIHCVLSSNFSLSEMSTLIDTLEAGVSELSVSVSGFTNDIYQINHSGGDIEVVKRNLTDLAQYLSGSSLDIKVYVKYLEFDYNREQISAFREFSESLGLNFQVYPASGDPLTPVLNDFSTTDEITVDVREIGSSEKSLNPCALLFDVIALDCKGDAYLCCAYGNFENCRIGNFLEMDYEKMMLSRLFHPKCRTCTLFRRNPTNRDLTDIGRWFGKSFFGEDFIGLDSESSRKQSVVYSTEATESELENEALKRSITEYENKIAALNRSVVKRDADIAVLNKRIGDIMSSTSWRISSPLRLLKGILQKDS